MFLAQGTISIVKLSYISPKKQSSYKNHRSLNLIFLKTAEYVVDLF